MRLFGGPLPKAIELSAAAVEGRGRVLELACGTGLFSDALAPVVGELLATDYAEAMVAEARTRAGHHGNASFSQRDLYGRSRAMSAALAAVSFPGQRRFTLETLRMTIADAGLSVEQAELIPGLLPIGFVVARR